MGRVVLVTGVSRELGGRLAQRIAGDPGVSRVIGVDAVPPRADLGPVRFVRADIRNPVIAKVIAGEDVDTVAHTSVVPSHGSASTTKEHNVIGTMQLLAACQRASSIERLVVLSSAEVYGSTPRDPAMFTEDMSARRTPRTGLGKDCVEVEGYVRGFSRRRPDVVVTTLRSADSLAPDISSPLADYLRLPAIPKPVGFDARLQVVHEQDLLACLHHAALAGVGGTFNVAGDGVLLLSQAIRRLGRPILPLPAFAISALGRNLRPTGVVPEGFSAERVRFLTFGRGLDTSRTRATLGFQPTYTTTEAFADFARSLGPGVVDRNAVAALEDLVTSAMGAARG